MNEEQKPMEPIFRVVRGQTLRELSKEDLRALHQQIEREILGATVEALKGLYDEVDLVDRELWQRQ